MDAPSSSVVPQALEHAAAEHSALGHPARNAGSAVVVLAGLLFSFSVAFLALSAIPTLAQIDASFGHTVEPRPGDICVVCNQPITATDEVYMVNGQRVPVHAAECDAALRKNPERYLARLRPQGNQFMDADSGRSSASFLWLGFGGYVLLGLIFAGLCGYRALNRGINPIPWFFAGFFLNLPAYLVLLTRPPGPRLVAVLGEVPRGVTKIPVTHTPRPCRICGTLNHPSASFCSGCDSRLEPLVASEVAKAGLMRNRPV